MMNGLLVAGLLLGIGAPAPKEAPKKGPAAPSIVGMWEVQKAAIAGMYAYTAELGCCILVNRKHPAERRRVSMLP